MDVNAFFAIEINDHVKSKVESVAFTRSLQAQDNSKLNTDDSWRVRLQKLQCMYPNHRLRRVWILMKPFETKEGPLMLMLNRPTGSLRPIQKNLYPTRIESASKGSLKMDIVCHWRAHQRWMLRKCLRRMEWCILKPRKKHKNIDYVYAVIHNDSKGRDSAASLQTRTPCLKGLEPLIRQCSVEAVNRSSSLEPVNRSSSGADQVNHSDERSSSVEPVNHSQDELAGDEKKGYLYAAVDKANKKKGPPLKPSPYRGPVYADLNHPTTSNTGAVKREFLTVYADIDWLTTDASQSKLPEEQLHQTTEYDDR